MDTQIHTHYIQWNLYMCIVNILGLLIARCSDYQDILIFQINLYDKVPFRTIIVCVCVFVCVCVCVVYMCVYV